MNHSILFTTLGLLLALVVMERLAAVGLRANEAIWRRHYAAIPVGATVMAELRWNRDTWITAFIDSSPEGFGSLRLVAHRPLSSREQAACLRWLRAEGFTDLNICRARETAKRPPDEQGG